MQNSSSSSGVVSTTVSQPGQSGQAADNPAVTQHEVVQPDAAQPKSRQLIMYWDTDAQGKQFGKEEETTN